MEYQKRFEKLENFETQDFKDIKEKAENNDPMYQAILSYRLYFGYGCILNKEKSKEWAIKSYLNGNKLGKALQVYFGFVGEQNFDEAFKLFNEIRESDILIEKLDTVYAINMIGYMIINSEGTKLDYEKAREYFELIENKNHAHTLTNLGFLYQKGNGVCMDQKKALYYFELASK